MAEEGVPLCPGGGSLKTGHICPCTAVLDQEIEASWQRVTPHRKMPLWVGQGHVHSPHPNAVGSRWPCL